MLNAFFRETGGAEAEDQIRRVCAGELCIEQALWNRYGEESAWLGKARYGGGKAATVEPRPKGWPGSVSVPAKGDSTT